MLRKGLDNRNINLITCVTVQNRGIHNFIAIQDIFKNK